MAAYFFLSYLAAKESNLEANLTMRVLQLKGKYNKYNYVCTDFRGQLNCPMISTYAKTNNDCTGVHQIPVKHSIHTKTDEC